jgi:hypothetical protein
MFVLDIFTCFYSQAWRNGAMQPGPHPPPACGGARKDLGTAMRLVIAQVDGLGFRV